MDHNINREIEILIRPPSAPRLRATVTPVLFKTALRKALDEATRAGSARTVFDVVQQNQGLIPQTLLLWITQVPEASSISFEIAHQRCARFLDLGQFNIESSCITLLQHDSFRSGEEKNGPRSALIILSKVEDAIQLGASLSDQYEQKLGEITLRKKSSTVSNQVKDFLSQLKARVSWPQWHDYEAINSEMNPKSRPFHQGHGVTTYISIATVILLILISIIFIFRSHPEAVYDRYDTTGSEGPKHQRRIYWQNASEWAAANPQDTGKWKVRIDDQAIIPAELFDEEEEHYQHWYRTRYPEMQEVIDKRNYVNPSWMGSLQMKVPWDDQFHFAHCVLALRRYWKAKETGKHVCGRDIDYLHIDHCLGALEKRVFIDGPREQTSPQWYMYWQTKVCF